GPVGEAGEDPKTLGFEVNIAGCAYGQPGSYYGEDGYGNLNPKRKKRAVPGLEAYHRTDTFLSEALTREAKTAIDASLKAQKPFFLYMAHYAVHSPFQADPRFSQNYDDSAKPKNAQAFATLIEGIDQSLGDLIDHVREKEVAENTFILFVGDNGSDAPLGDTDGYSSSAPLRAKKGTCYEGGIRVPFIAAWAKPSDSSNHPIPAGTVHQQMGTVMDLFPTILDLTGTAHPTAHPVDGVSLLPQFADDINPDRPDFFLCHFPHSHRSSYFTSYRQGDWKLIYRYREGRKRNGREPLPTYELYNLRTDPYETSNLAENESVRLSSLMTAMVSRLEAENAQFPEDEDGRPLLPLIP
ncbi:MAG: sulfatase-like hydrolase/transferase, partial [Verrucomicrobiota bacterium]